jgi:hypothetical protein
MPNITFLNVDMQNEIVKSGKGGPKRKISTRVLVEKFWTEFGPNFTNSTYTRVTKTISQNVPKLFHVCFRTFFSQKI